LSGSVLMYRKVMESVLPLLLVMFTGLFFPVGSNFKMSKASYRSTNLSPSPHAAIPYAPGSLGVSFFSFQKLTGISCVKQMVFPVLLSKANHCFSEAFHQQVKLPEGEICGLPETGWAITVN